MPQKKIIIVILFFIPFIIFNVGTVNSFSSETVLSETRPVTMVACSTYEPQFEKYYNRFKLVNDGKNRIYIGGYVAHSSYDSMLLATNFNGELLWENLSTKGVFYDITLDHEGNIYYTGIKYVDMFNSEIALWKYNNSGTFIWERLINGSDAEWGRGISVDTFNNIYVAGYNASGGIIVAKYNPNGEQEWLREWGKDLDATCLDCTTDYSDNVYLVGSVRNRMGSQMCIVKLDSLGEEMWNLTFPCAEGVRALQSLWRVKSSADKIYVIGDIFERTIYVAKFDSNGYNLWNTIWALDDKLLGVSDLAIDSDENVYVVGVYKPYDTDDWRYQGQLYSYLAKFHNGNERWHYQWQFSEYTFSNGIALIEGEIYVCGHSNGTLYLAKFSESEPIIALYFLFSWVGGALVIFIIIHSASRKKKIRDR